jgi:hypothetical protein
MLSLFASIFIFFTLFKLAESAGEIQVATGQCTSNGITPKCGKIKHFDDDAGFQF